MRSFHALILAVLLCFAASAQLGPALDVTLPGMNTQGATIQLADGQASSSVSVGLPATPSDPEMIQVVLAGPLLEVELTLPGGTIVNQNTAASAGYEFTVIDMTDAALEGAASLLFPPTKTAMIHIPASRPAGNYQVRVHRSGTAGPMFAVVTYLGTDGFSAVPFAHELQVRAGEPAGIGVYLDHNHTPISTATVTAETSLTRVVAGSATSLTPLGSSAGEPGKRIFSYRPVFTIPGAPLKRVIAYPEAATGKFSFCNEGAATWKRDHQFGEFELGSGSRGRRG